MYFKCPLVLEINVNYVPKDNKQEIDIIFFVGIVHTIL
jgi:hypothetical protein